MSKTRFTFELSELSGNEEERIGLVRAMLDKAGLSSVWFTTEVMTKPSIEPSVIVDVSLTGELVPVEVLGRSVTHDVMHGRKATVLVRAAGTPVASGKDVSLDETMDEQVKRAALDVLQQLRYIHDQARQYMVKTGILK